MKGNGAVGVSLVLLAAIAMAAAGSGGKLTCCQQAALEGRECTHRCCLTAHRSGKSCAKCNPTGEDLRLTKIGKQRFYVQLVLGSNQEVRPLASAKPVGPKLVEKLNAVFKWKRFWEIQRDAVVLTPGLKVRRDLLLGKEVEVELLDAGRLSVRVYLNNRLFRSRNQPAEGAFYVTGGQSSDDQSWFVVVRGDRPVDPGSA